MTEAALGRSLSDVVSKRAAAHLRAFRREVDQALPGRVVEVILFGSRARGDARPDSDYDIAVVVDGSHVGRRLNHLLSDIAYPHLLAGIHIRPIGLAGASIAPGGHPLAASIARDGIAIR